MRKLKISSTLSSIFLITFYVLRLLPLLSFFPHPPSIAGPVTTFFWHQSLDKNLRLLLELISITTILTAFLSIASFTHNLFLRRKYQKWSKWLIIIGIFYIPVIIFVANVLRTLMIW